MGQVEVVPLDLPVQVLAPILPNWETPHLGLRIARASHPQPKGFVGHTQSSDLEAEVG